MQIRLVAFASAAEIVGPEREVALGGGARLGDLKRHLEERFPALVPIWPRLAIAIDGELVPAGEDPQLTDGVEVALLPPVSGGMPAETLVDGPIDVAAVERAVASPACGAVVLFLGTVRDHHAGRAVVRLEYSAYRPMADRSLRRIVDALEADNDVRAAIVHRLGEVPIGEPSVVIAVAAPHRKAAYEASRTALERLKREAPIWKREHYGNGDVAWREEETLDTPTAALS